MQSITNVEVDVSWIAGVISNKIYNDYIQLSCSGNNLC